MTMNAAALDKIAQVLDVHRWKSMGVSSVECECGAVVTDEGPALLHFPADEAFRRHVAQEIAHAIDATT